jgi:hypothetical protein
MIFPMGMQDRRRVARRNRAVAFCLFASMLFAGAARAQQPASEGPAAALSSALSAACKQDSETFANALTSDNAAAYRALPGPQRTALMKRFVLLDEPGRTLLSTSAAGRTVMRCETPGFTTEMRFGETRLRENLAFIPMDIPLPGEGARSVTFGLVREGGNWKLLSVGLILLDIPLMAKQWEQADMDASEDNAIANLRAVAAALETYRRAYGDWPESLAVLGPAPPGGVSPQAAGLIDADLSAGNKGGYAIRYSIVPAGGNAAAGETNRPETFVLAASPGEYGKSGRRSFFLDSTGALHGADKQGAPANSTDPLVGPSDQ